MATVGTPSGPDALITLCDIAIAILICYKGNLDLAGVAIGDGSPSLCVVVR